MTKRAFDVVLSLCAIVLLAPLFLIVALMIRCNDRGPIFFCQKRVGLGGREFFIYKFRTMIVGAETKGPYFTKRNDKRITRLGGFLRKSSIDELPQVVNILKGEMSLVGPRPDTPAQKTLYDAIDWEKRVSVRPGLTGLAQVELRSEDSHESRLKLDLKYIENNDISLDILIILRTVLRLDGRGSF